MPFWKALNLTVCLVSFSLVEMFTRTAAGEGTWPSTFFCLSYLDISFTFRKLTTLLSC